MQSTSNKSQDGLYNRFFEHDACGVGLVCKLDAIPTHELVQQGLQVLENLDHRGATGCDPDTGDGAGILTQLPHEFFLDVADSLSFRLPDLGDYGAGLVFLPRDADLQLYFKELIESVVSAEGQVVLAWRRVPTNLAVIGTVAREAAPTVWQLFIGRGPGCPTSADFERKLFIIRKVLERAAKGASVPGSEDFYLPSLSSRTIIYKGMLTTSQLPAFFTDLGNPAFKSAIAMVHSRFSTNTFPQWSLAQPFRFLCHNGEINTLRGNINWMNARQALFASDAFGDDIEKLIPILEEGGSDSQILDNALELLMHTGRSLPHAMMMLVPEAWEHNPEMPEEKRAFYEYHSCLMEPWDGPATLPFTDGRYVGAVLDRNGLRPSRYTLTHDGLVVLASETGVLDIDPADIKEKGRLQPGRMFLVDLEENRIIPDDEIKHAISTAQPYRFWLNENLTHVDDLVDAVPSVQPDSTLPLLQRQQMFGYTREDERLLLTPMFFDGKEALGSMGDDTPLAVLSEKPRMLYDYFKQLFAQVTNPPLDAIREEIVTSLYTRLGQERGLFQESAEHCRMVHLDHPVLANEQLLALEQMDQDGLRATTLHTVFSREEGLGGAMERLSNAAAEAVDAGYSLLILTDRAADQDHVPIPALLATAGVHHHLIRTGRRTQCSLIVESGEPREVHHFALLIGYGADAINPYLVYELVREKAGSMPDAGDAVKWSYNYRKAVGKGLLKVMSKMGISTIQSYRGAQIFEAVGIGSAVIDAYFTNTPSRLAGIGIEEIEREAMMRHERAFPDRASSQPADLDVGGRYQWRRNGEHHHFNPEAIGRLQAAVRSNKPESYNAFAGLTNELSKRKGTLRGMLRFQHVRPSVSLEEVEPWTEIVKRFKTGAMSYGSISSETHEALAVAMNKLGGRSNTGEGGEHPDRYENGNSKRSRIKQVASGRFGVTISYLASADEIQIKMAQGAKPGEGGQLPGEKVYPWIAEVRHSTPYVGLISPPPHHDIYSIEDLAQLIYDLKNTNPEARVSVKLVSEVGVGTVAAGVAKGKADVVLISGHDGGTGASPQTSVMHAGLPWELGLAETHQTLLRNGLRSRIRVECDGQLKTGRDVAIACLLGAEEFGFATAPLIALGCIMMRKCHLNTCPVGIATQDPELRKHFKGEPEHVVNYFHFVAEELRTIMAELGFRTIDEMVGQVSSLDTRRVAERWKARHLDLQPLLQDVQVPAFMERFLQDEQAHNLGEVLDAQLIEQTRAAWEEGKAVTITTEISNRDRTLGTMLSGHIAKQVGIAGLPDNTIRIHAIGSAGQSCGAFMAKGINLSIEGDANDYFGKGLSGGRLSVRPPVGVQFAAEDNVIIGNVALFGATSGKAFISGRAGERFAVRNSGATAVVEGIGDHGCEYMTGGQVVVLGETGRNFAAGMSGGIAYIWDATGAFAERGCPQAFVELTGVEDEEERLALRAIIGQHVEATGSSRAATILEHWEEEAARFVKVMPVDYKRALERLEAERAQVEKVPVLVESR